MSKGQGSVFVSYASQDLATTSQWRQDTESLHAQLERDSYGERVPAWGVHNQTAVVPLHPLPENA